MSLTLANKIAKDNLLKAKNSSSEVSPMKSNTLGNDGSCFFISTSISLLPPVIKIDFIFEESSKIQLSPSSLDQHSVNAILENHRPFENEDC